MMERMPSYPPQPQSTVVTGFSGVGVPAPDPCPPVSALQGRYSNRYSSDEAEASATTGPTLHDVLVANGLTHAPSGKGYRRHILDGDRVVFTGTAGQVWAWLRASGRYPLSVECAA